MDNRRPFGPRLPSGAIPRMRLVGAMLALLLLAHPALRARQAPWNRHVIDRSSVGADGVRLAFINEDGLPDIVTGWEEGGLVRLYLHPGFLSARRPWPSVTAGVALDVEDAWALDADGDGSIREIVSASEGSTRRLQLHRAGPSSDLLDPRSWQSVSIPASEGLMQWMVTVGGPPGLLFAGGKNEHAAVGFFDVRDPDPEQWTWYPLAPAGWVMTLETVDMDGDGDLDLLLSDRRGPLRGVRWLENPGAAETRSRPWTEHFVGGVDHEVMFIRRADLDGDGQDDLLAATSGGPILLFRRLDATGDHWQTREIPMPGEAGTGKSIAAGDVDGDGRLDLVVSSEHAAGLEGVIWMWAEADPWESEWMMHPLSGPVGTKYDLVELIDLDGDGDLDVLTCEEVENLGVIWYENPMQ